MNRSLYEVEAHAHLLAVAGLASATSSRLDSAANAAQMAGLQDVARQLEKVREFHRLYTARVASLIRQVEGGAR